MALAVNVNGQPKLMTVEAGRYYELQIFQPAEISGSGDNESSPIALHPFVDSVPTNTVHSTLAGNTPLQAIVIARPGTWMRSQDSDSLVSAESQLRIAADALAMFEPVE